MEVIKSDRYTKNDVQVYLKKRVKNMGLLSKIITPPYSTIVNQPSSNGNYIFYDTYYGGNYLLLRSDMNFNLINTIATTPTGAEYTRGISTFYDESCFVCSGFVTPHVFLANISGEITKIGTEIKGAGDDDWDGLGQISTNKNGQLYVCDGLNNRVKVYDYGVYSAKVTTSTRPIFITSDSLGNVYAATWNTATADNKIYKYNKDLTAVTNWTVDVAADTNVYGIVCDNVNSKIYINSKEQNKILSYNLDGSGVATLINTANAYDVATNGVYIALTNNNTDIRVFDIAGNLLRTITKTGATFSNVSIYNNIIYAQNGNNIITYNIDGTNETALINAVVSVSSFCIDSKGLVYLADITNDVILKYNAVGEYVSAFGSVGAGDGQIDTPQGLTYNTFNSKIVCADYGNTRLQSFQYGKLIDVITTAGVTALNVPVGICFDDEGSWYTQDNTSTIFKFSKVNSFISSYLIEYNAVRRLYFSTPENAIYISRPLNAIKYNLSDNFTKYYYLGYEETYSVNFFIYGSYVYNAVNTALGTDALVYRYEITPDYDSTWINITQDLINKELELKYTTEESNFSLGKVEIGDFDIELLNVNDKYDFETNPDSLFYSALGTYQRNNSLVKIELAGKELSRMLIDGKNITNKENVIKFKLYNPFKYFETIGSNTIKKSLADGDNISDVIPFLVNNRFFENIVEYNAGDIDIYYDAVINNVSELPDNCFDLLKTLSQMGKFKFGLYAGSKFYANNIIDKMALRTADYLITENNLIDVSAYNNGEHRLFKNVEIKYTTGTATYTIPENVQLCFNEDRTVSFDIACITSAVIAQQVADDFANFSSWPSKEIEIKIPIMNNDNNLFDKVYAFNIFDSTRGIKFNTLSLVNGNAELPTKETATQNGRILYYPLSVKHRVGREYTTVLKLKEFIADTL
jgi:hypothetical protein